MHLCQSNLPHLPKTEGLQGSSNQRSLSEVEEILRIMCISRPQKTRFLEPANSSFYSITDFRGLSTCFPLKDDLLTGIHQASLTQYLGNMSQAWILNSYAARLITALEYHEIRKPQVNSHHDDEIHRAVSWCFYLDRSLSTLLYRPLSLPEPRISPANLISDYECIPYIPLIRILFDLAQIQGELLACGNADNTPQIIANHSNLQERMEAIHSRLQTVSRAFCLARVFFS